MSKEILIDNLEDIISLIHRERAKASKEGNNEKVMLYTSYILTIRYAMALIQSMKD